MNRTTITSARREPVPHGAKGRTRHEGNEGGPEWFHQRRQQSLKKDMVAQLEATWSAYKRCAMSASFTFCLMQATGPGDRNGHLSHPIRKILSWPRKTEPILRGTQQPVAARYVGAVKDRTSHIT
jgi:hypothetical protein